MQIILLSPFSSATQTSNYTLAIELVLVEREYLFHNPLSRADWTIMISGVVVLQHFSNSPMKSYWYSSAASYWS